MGVQKGTAVRVQRKETFVFTDTVKGQVYYRACFQGKLLAPAWNSDGAARVYLEAVARGERKPEYDSIYDTVDGPVDENGCHTLPDGSCISKGPCMHTEGSDNVP